MDPSAIFRPVQRAAKRASLNAGFCALAAACAPIHPPTWRGSKMICWFPSRIAFNGSAKTTARYLRNLLFALGRRPQDLGQPLED